MKEKDSIVNDFRDSINKAREFKRQFRGKVFEKPLYDVSLKGAGKQGVEYHLDKLENMEAVKQWAIDIRKRIDREKVEWEEKKSKLYEEERAFAESMLDWEKEARKKEKEINNIRIGLARRESRIERDSNELDRKLQVELAQRQNRFENKRGEELSALKTEYVVKEQRLADDYRSREHKLEIEKLRLENEGREMERQKSLNENNAVRFGRLESEMKREYEKRNEELKRRQEEANAIRVRLDLKKGQLNSAHAGKIEELDREIEKYKEKARGINSKVAENKEKTRDAERLLESSLRKIKRREEVSGEQDDEIGQLREFLAVRANKLGEIEALVREKDGEIKHSEELLVGNNNKIKRLEESLRSFEERVAKLNEAMKKEKDMPAPDLSSNREERMAVVEDIVVGIGHQLRNPLGIIQSNAQFCLSKFRLKDRVEKNISTILRNSESAGKKLEELVKIMRPIHVSLVSLPFPGCLDRVCLLIEERCREQEVQLVKKYPGDLPEVRFDQNRMDEAFLSVLLNSLEAMPKGGELTVMSRVDTVKKEIVVKITDTGNGISGDHIGLVMAPFFTTKEDSMGLGLYQVQRVMDLHNGSISLESEKDKGTTVTCRIPVAGK